MSNLQDKQNQLYQLLILLKPGERCLITEVNRRLKLNGNQLTQLLDFSALQSRDDLFLDQGYVCRMSESSNLLDTHAVGQHHRNMSIEMSYLPSCPSTIDVAKSVDRSPMLVIAESQSKSRGQNSKHWFAPMCGNIYATYALEYKNVSQMPLHFYTVAATYSLFRYVRDLIGDNHIMIKWPNDIMVNQKKIAGILVESESISRHMTRVFLSIGLNVNMNSDRGNEIDQPWTSCFLQSKRRYSTTDVINRLSTILFGDIKSCESMHNRQHMIDVYNANAMYLNQTIAIVSNHKTSTGLFKGLDCHGVAQLDTGLGYQSIYGGHINRPVES